MKTIFFKAGYVTAWLWNREDMPLDISIGDQIIIAGPVIVGLVILSFL